MASVGSRQVVVLQQLKHGAAADPALRCAVAVLAFLEIQALMLKRLFAYAQQTMFADM
jgi:hypothetical protein